MRGRTFNPVSLRARTRPNRADPHGFAASFALDPGRHKNLVLSARFRLGYRTHRFLLRALLWGILSSGWTALFSASPEPLGPSSLGPPEADRLLAAACLDGSHAWALHLAGRYEEAAGCARECLESGCPDAQAAYAYLSATLRLGDEADLEAAVDLDSLVRTRHPGRASLAAEALTLFASGARLRLTGTPAAAESLLLAAETAFAELSRARAGADHDDARLLEAGRLMARAQRAAAVLAQARVADAHALLADVLTEAERAGLETLAVWVRRLYGLTRYYQQDLSGADALLRQAVREAHDAGLHDLEGDTRLTLSSLARERLDLQAALEERLAAREAFRRAGNLSGESRALRYAAVVRIMEADYGTALADLQDAGRCAEAARDQAQAVACLADLGGLYYRIGHLREAEAAWQQALARGEPAGSPTWTSGVLSNLGVLALDQQQYAQAQQYFARALTFADATGDTRAAISVRANRGRCACEAGSFEEGIADLQAAARDARQWERLTDEIHALCDLGDCWLRVGTEEARRRAAAVAATAESLASEAGAPCLREKAVVLRAKVAEAGGDTLGAIAALRESIALMESTRSESAAAADLQAYSFQRAGDVYALLIHLIAESGGAANETFALMQRAKAGTFAQLLRESGAELHPRRSGEYRDQADRITHEIQETVVALEALSWPAAGDETTGRGAASDGANGQGATGDGAAADSLRNLTLHLRRLEDELLVAEGALRAADPRYAAYRLPQVVEPLRFQHEVLRPDELYLDYLLGERASYLWAVDRDGLAMYRLPPREAIIGRLDAVLPLLRDVNLTGDEPAYLAGPLRELSAVLLGPVWTRLEDADRMIVAPDGRLHYLPFEVLLADSCLAAERPPGADREAGTAGNAGLPPSARSYADLPYVIKQWDVQYAPSAGVLDMLRAHLSARPDERSRVLLIGNPLRDVSGRANPLVAWSASANAPATAPSAAPTPAPVPGAAEEAAAILSCFSHAQATRLIGPAATKTNLRTEAVTGAYGFIHFATHGIYNEYRPRYSGLALTPSEGDDGLLSVAEVYSMSLPCRVLVLSACSTGLGELLDGEGMSGLVRAFLYAGADNIIATLWDVPGVPTAEFMGAFYQACRLQEAAGPDAPGALGEAKRRMIRLEMRAGEHGFDRAHPYFWSGYVLTGCGR